MFQATTTALPLALDYEPHSAVRRLERTITARDGAPPLDFTLKVFARHKGPISAGVHPNFGHAGKPRPPGAKVDFAFGLAHPGRAPSPDQHEFSSLSSVPQGRWSRRLLAHPAQPAQRLTQRGALRRHQPAHRHLSRRGRRVRARLGTALLPPTLEEEKMFWHTDGGIGGEPWRNQFSALGCEPLASAFDFHTDVCTGPNPINACGVKTWIDLDPARPQGDQALGARLPHLISSFPGTLSSPMRSGWTSRTEGQPARADPSRFRLSGGTELSFLTAGDPSNPRRCLLLRGFPSSAPTFRDVIPALSEPLYVIAPDLPGFGESDMLPATVFAAFAAAIAELLDHLDVGPRYIYLHDFGAPVGFAIAIAQPAQVLGLTIQNGNTHESGFGPEWGATSTLGPIRATRTPRP